MCSAQKNAMEKQSADGCNGQLRRPVAETSHNSMSYANIVGAIAANVSSACSSQVQHWRWLDGPADCFRSMLTCSAE